MIGSRDRLEPTGWDPDMGQKGGEEGRTGFRSICVELFIFFIILLMFFSFVLRFLCLPLLFLGSVRHNFQSFQYLLTKAAFSLKRYTSCGSTQMLLKLFLGRFVGI